MQFTRINISKTFRNGEINASNITGSGIGGGSSNIDLSGFVRLRGQTSQTIEGAVAATGDIIAYQINPEAGDFQFPIASTDALGTIKVGSGLKINTDGTLSVDGEIGGGGVSSWNDLTDKPEKFPPETHQHKWDAILNKPTNFKPSAHTHPMSNITDFNGVTIDTDQTITGQKTFSKAILGQADVVAYATGKHDITFPIASKTALGCIKVGENLTITEDGTLNAQAGGGITSVTWGDVQDKPIFSTVATSGSYTDLLNKPSLFSGNYNDLTNKPTIPTNNNQLTNGAGYITGINLSMWNGAATSVGNKTIGNSSNGNYVNIVEDLKVTQNCTFSKTPKVGSTAVALSNHTHSNYVSKSGDTMTGNLLIQNKSSDYNYIRCLNKSGQYIQFTSQPGGGGVIQDESKDNHLFIIQVGASYPNNVQFTGGNIKAAGSITAYASSDKRLKQDIQPLNNSLNFIIQLEPVSFKWNDKAIKLDRFKNKEELQFGLIAQEVEKILPEIVHNQYVDEEGTTYKAIDYVRLVPFLINAVQELSLEIRKLKNQNHLKDEEAN